MTHNKYVPFVPWLGQNEKVMPQLHKTFEESSGGRGGVLAMTLVCSAVTIGPRPMCRAHGDHQAASWSQPWTMLSLVSDVGPGSTLSPPKLILLSPTPNTCLSAFLSAGECVTFCLFHMEFCLPALCFNPGGGVRLHLRLTLLFAALLNCRFLLLIDKNTCWLGEEGGAGGCRQNCHKSGNCTKE